MSRDCWTKPTHCFALDYTDETCHVAAVYISIETHSQYRIKDCNNNIDLGHLRCLDIYMYLIFYIIDKYVLKFTNLRKQKLLSTSYPKNNILVTNNI